MELSRHVSAVLWTTCPLLYSQHHLWFSHDRAVLMSSSVLLTRHWAQSFPCPLGVSGEARVPHLSSKHWLVQSALEKEKRRKGKVPVYWVYQLLDYSNKSHINVKWFNTTFHTWHECLKKVQMSANIARMFAQCSYSISDCNLWKVFQKVLLTSPFFLNIITLTSP